MRQPTVESLTAGTDRLSVVENRSLSRQDVNSACELPKVQRSVSVQRPVSLHGDLDGDAFKDS